MTRKRLMRALVWLRLALLLPCLLLLAWIDTWRYPRPGRGTRPDRP